MDGQGTSSGRAPLSSGGEVASKNRYDPDGHGDDDDEEDEADYDFYFFAYK